MEYNSPAELFVVDVYLALEIAALVSKMAADEEGLPVAQAYRFAHIRDNFSGLFPEGVPEVHKSIWKILHKVSPSSTTS